MRLDKFLCEINIGSRNQVKVFLKKGQVTVNGIIITEPDTKIDENKDQIAFKGSPCHYKKYIYYMLNKPQGVVSATEDNTCRTVVDLLKDTGYKDLFPVGRLDKDTEGLLLMTNDGELAHKLLSPRKHVAKVYYVKLETPISKSDIECLKQGVDIGEAKKTLPAKVELSGDKELYLTITEGKFHQVKRMMQAVGNKVVYLKRMAMGGLYLDEALPNGCYRELTEEEVIILENS